MTITMLVALTILFLIFLQRPIFAGFIECSDDYFADYQVYGPCIAQKCGRFALTAVRRDPGRASNPDAFDLY